MMEGAITATLKSLPVDTNPRYAVKVSLDRLQTVILRTEKVLAPSIWRKLLGGTSTDHARSVVAVSLEDARAIRGVISTARQIAFSSSDPALKALIGSSDRVIKALDSWRESAIDFEEAIYGSNVPLLARSKKLIVLCTELKSPASGIA